MPRSADTKTALLEAGHELLLQQGLPPTLNIRLTEVVEHAGMTTGAAYNIWKSQAAYLRDLSLHLASNFAWADTNSVAEAIATLGPDSVMADWVDAVCNAYFPVFVENQNFFLVLHFWGVRDPDPDLRDAMVAGYEVVHEGFEFLYKGTIRRYGLEVTPPFTLADITTMVTASLEGLALRYRYQPQRVELEGRHLFNAMVQTIAATYLQPSRES